jgi:hypothetical protein
MRRPSLRSASIFDDDRVRKRITKRQHPDHVVGLASMPDTRLVRVGHASRNFRALMRKYDRLVHVLFLLTAVPKDRIGVGAGGLTRCSHQ